MEIDDEIKRTWRRQRRDYSAGGVAYRWLAAGDLEIALIATRKGTRWQLPKGTCEVGEAPAETARREVHEEAGLATVDEGFLQGIDYWYWDTYRKPTPELVHKHVDFFLLRVVGGQLSDASFEVDSVAWFTLGQAVEVLTFPGEQAVVLLALERLRPPHSAAAPPSVER